MAKKLFIVTDADGTVTRVRADSLKRNNMGDRRWFLEFFENGEKDPAGAMFVTIPFSVFLPHLLYQPFGTSILDPFATTDAEQDVGFLSDTLFTEAEKRPFSPDERNQVIAALEEAKEVIHTEFATTSTQQNDINSKIDYLERKVTELDKFNWKRLFVSTLVGISVDLLFGTVIPSSLIDAFKQVMSYFADKKLLSRTDKNGSR
jgi:hypothetical protein